MVRNKLVDEFGNICNEFGDPINFDSSAGCFKKEPDGTDSKEEIDFKLQQAMAGINMNKTAKKIINGQI